MYSYFTWMTETSSLPYVTMFLDRTAILLCPTSAFSEGLSREHVAPL